MAKPVGRDLEKTLRDGIVRGLPIFAFSFYFLKYVNTAFIFWFLITELSEG
jgi:hypothetical protein